MKILNGFYFRCLGEKERRKKESPEKQVLVQESIESNLTVHQLQPEVLDVQPQPICKIIKKKIEIHQPQAVHDIQ